MIHFDMPELRQMWFILGKNDQEPTPEMKKMYHSLEHYQKESLLEAREHGKVVSS